MIGRNTRESALRQDEFHTVLQRWLDESFDDRVGDPTTHAGPEWLWVRHGGNHFYLHADSTRAGVREYLHVVAECGGDADWHLQSSVPGIRDRVVVGDEERIVDGFDFYRHVPER
jgi:hypothetical protein